MWSLSRSAAETMTPSGEGVKESLTGGCETKTWVAPAASVDLW